MLKHFLTIILAFFTASVFAASADVNKATQAELESIKGIGPAMSAHILDERKKGEFKDWPDLIARVKGLGDAKAGHLSAEGLTVNGTGYGKKKGEDKKTSRASDKKADKSDKAASAEPAEKAASSKADDAKKDGKKAAAKADEAASKPAAAAKK